MNLTPVYTVASCRTLGKSGRTGVPPANGNIHLAESALMGTMTKKLLFVMTILLVASFALMAADVSG